MPGDIDMLRNFASAWLSRFSSGAPPPPTLPLGTSGGAAGGGRKEPGAMLGLLAGAAGGASDAQGLGPWLHFVWGVHWDLQPQGAQLHLVPETSADSSCAHCGQDVRASAATRNDTARDFLPPQ